MSGFFTIILLCGFVIVAWQVVELRRRMRDAEDARIHIERELGRLRALLGARATEEDGPTPAATTPGPVPPSAGPPLAPPIKPTAPLWPTPSPAAAIAPARPAPAAAATRPSSALWDPATAAAQPASRGPGATTRLLERLGLAPTKEGGQPSRAAIEAWLEGRMLAVVGGIALTLGAAFFLSLAFSRGWITEPMRVLIGLAGGSLAMGLGEVAFLKLKGIVGHVLLAVGLAIISLSLFSATRLFGLIPPEAGVAAALLAAVVAAAIAIRHDSQVVAAFGLVSVLASPPLLGASPTTLTILFLATALIGTTAIALFRTWVWLPPIAFLLAAPQVASSATDAESLPMALATIVGFWLLNTIAAGGEEIRHPANRLRPSTVTLLLASAVFTLWAGTTVLNGDYARWRGSFVAALAIAHLVIGLGLLVRFGDRHPFGLVVAATGVASITMAVPIQFGATWVPVAWAAEAVALAWLARVYRHPYAAGAAVVVGAISLGHLLLVEYPLDQMAQGFDRAWPFVGPEGLTFAFLAAATLAAGVIVPVPSVRAGLAIVGILTTVYVLPFETSGTVLVAAWSALTAGAMVGWRLAVEKRLPPGSEVLPPPAWGLPDWARPIEEFAGELRGVVRPAFAWTVPVPIAAAIVHLMAFEYPVLTLGGQVISGVPYVSIEGIAAVAVVGGLLSAGALAARQIRLACAGVALMVVTYTLAFEVLAPWVMLPWGVVAVGSLVVVRRVAVVDLRSARLATSEGLAESVPFVAAAFALLCMTVDALLYAPPGMFGEAVAGTMALPETPFVDDRSVALAALAVTLVATGIAWGGVSALATGLVAAGFAIAWLLPFELRPAFAITGWSAIAAAGFVLISRRPAMRVLVGVWSVGLLAFGGLVALVVVAPPSRLVVDAATVVAGGPLITDATIALASLAIACAIGVALHRGDPASRTGAVTSALLLLYAASVGVVDVFQGQVGTRPLEDLQREAQVALSLLWSALGGIAFVVGLVTRLGPVRRAGLALLGLATAKVFIVDLASLDVAYRVLSLVGLGVLLLVSAVVYARIQQREAPTAGS